MDKTRLDVYLCESALVRSREKARALIMEGKVLINGSIADKAGIMVKPDDTVILKDDPCPFVSRGGLKLQKALSSFEINPNGKVCLDVGASTGGFTHCLLLGGAKKVYSVDVGYNQLAYSLRTDERVISIERTNFRHMEFEKIGEKVQLIVMDVSFISIIKLAEKLCEFADENTILIALIKPQFESDKGKVGKNGVITDLSQHEEIVNRVINAMTEKGIFLSKLDYSPVKGPKGNIEFISLFSFNESDAVLDTQALVKNIVTAAHCELDR